MQRPWRINETTLRTDGCREVNGAAMDASPGRTMGTLLPPISSIAAAAFGLSSLERHITLDRTMYGSDQKASIEEPGLRQLVQSVRKISKALGDGKKRFYESEKVVADKLRKHIK